MPCGVHDAKTPLSDGISHCMAPLLLACLLSMVVLEGNCARPKLGHSTVHGTLLHLVHVLVLTALTLCSTSHMQQF